ncbi:hypothetical protein WR25_08453 isoform F [Diploscapter pachys]|uniref:Laminin-like protein epi-1 n=1 Tax=Diploscapter pachys TaxID=2018661 RepID=A0A2A2LZK1_9BILA|nr:hypothetical protein WR25_08453 isoform F [Diploscapter pachys]
MLLPSFRLPSRVLVALLVVVLALLAPTQSQVLTPSQILISHRKPIHSSATCGEINGQPIREIYCSLTGSSQYTPLSSYSYKDEPDSPNFDALQEARSPRELFIQGGHGCGVCEANTVNAHPASNMVDGNNSWWMSPPLARGLQYNQVNITIDLEQEFHVAYVWIQMANTPRPGSWVLERSKDYGKTYEPWFYFAENSAECMRRFGAESLAPIADETSVICRTDMSSLQPLENAEMVVRVLEHRPSSEKFGSSEALQNFTRATNVRIRLLGTRTLRGHLMDMNESKDPSVTRRYFYAIKEIMMGGRCVCNGHAGTCDILDQRRPRAFLCRCEHNTCGDMCEMCCPGFVQKKWEPATANNNFTCEPCNCFGRSNECVYDEELEKNKQSLDIHGNYEGGGRCLNCRFNTEGINCNKCSFGYYRPEGAQWNETMPCKRCQCDPNKHTDGCAESTGKCECQPRFEGEDCDRCAKGYYGPPECKPCDCNVNGTEGEMCQPEDGQCPCKTGFGGIFCETCSPGYTNVTAGCHECVCDEQGSENKNCSATTSQCTCKEGFSGLSCNECKTGFYGFPNCTFCNCDPLGTEGGMCDATTGQCLCKEGFAGDKCDHCDIGYYSYPHCKPCGCDGAGTNSPECNTVTGQCQCSANFTGRICDKCAAGFYEYPNCRECSCLIEGAKGQTCDAKGQCYCKDNFDGERCERCKPNFYNYPACEECNCNPNGVTQNFGGCDKVAPGELCECRKNVIGRICDTCRPTTWNLQYYHTDGCVDCMCNLNGTISGLNICNQKSGQCVCKRYASGRKCDQCAEGYYNLQGYNQMGCQPCNCDAGGSLRTSECDMETGQCKCRPRVSGARCDKPIENHYYPTLLQYLHEAEDGHTETNRPVRYAVDASHFPNFSWRGYAVFSPIQEHVILDVDIPKASVYRLLYKYKNPTPVTIAATVTASPLISHSQPDSVQTTKVSFPTGDQSAIKEITIDDKPFVLNPGKWAIRTSTKQRLFLDYIVLLPSEYYEATLLRQPTPPPCLSNASVTAGPPCLDLLYPPLPSPVRADEADGEKVFNYVDSDGITTPLEKVPVEILPEIIGSASYVQTSNDSRVIETRLFVPEDGEYAILIEYHNLEEKEQKTTVEVQQDGEVAINGSLRIRHCPFSTFCRSVATDMGNVAFAKLKEGKATVQIRVLPNHQFGLASVNLIRKSEFSEQYLKQVPVCLRKNQKCIPQSYPPAPDSVTADAKTSAPAKAITGDKLPFPVAHPEQVAVVSLDEGQGTVEISGVVPSRGHYMFLVHYYNHDNTALDVDVLLQNDQFYEATVPLAYCPSIMGCRALIRMKERPEVIQFWVENKYTATLRHNESQKGPIYIDSITAIPYHSYSERLMTPLAMDQSRDFIEQCSGMHFENHPENVSDFCKDKIFSLTTDFNSAALSCDCVAQGSESFSCNEYGGQCSCKPNIIGRRCDRCASGYYNFPQCLKCQCSTGQQCDPTNGQCFCPPHVEGTSCNKCVSNAFGYDPLIGCQKCDCHPQGSEGASMVCDAETGQCLCRPSVGGRSCDQCLPGYYGFPHCYQCRCQTSGTRESICDPATATCQCKENVYGPQCDTCKPGTFDLSNDNPLGCVNCFCFGVTESCRSSNLPISISSVDMSAFLTTDDHGAVDIKDDQVIYAADANSPASVYFVVPINVGADHTTSYGLLLTFKMSVQPKSEQQKNANTDADVRIRGRNMTAEFWASEQPVDFQEEFTVKARLNPENWQTPEGKPLTRKDLMMILQSLQSIHLKASYYDNPKSAKLVEFGLEVANEQPNRYASSLLAASVEQCQCPAPYTGLSCQLCAPGYYRVQSGSMLGACVPCDCNGHSGTCDPDTGICSMCEHNTYGDHCEFCSEGHYGDATTGSPYACLPCQCPYAPDNNFATSCVATEYGDMQSCSCKEGYSGDRCERCDTGYYGEPQQVGGSCKQCDCNSNNNLTDPRSCHPISGDCYQCEYNTQGRHCEYCAPWFHGDAITAKNCTSCTCDQCGSAQCDNKNGKCVCKPNVEGDDCERCAPNHFGYSRCEGCRPCHCGVAASTGQCDDNGQCTCRPGAAGVRCEHCEHGYWNYGENGCEKCDCEADLSLGTVCDVRTGQCHCQEGATGPRCDECLKSYLRIPTLGCRRCDECVHSLIADVDTLQLQIEVLNTSIGNISSATVVGARLSRNKKRLQEYADLSELLTNSDDNMLGDTRHVLNNRTSIVSIANRYVDNLEEARSKSENLTQKTTDLKREIDRKSGEATREIDATARLAAAIGEHASALRFDQRQITDAEETLRNLEAATADTKNPKIDESPKKIAETIKKINGKTDKIKEQKDKIEKSKQKQVDALKYIGDAEKQLKDAKNKAEKATQKATSLNLAKIEGLNDAVGYEIEKFDEEKKGIADKNIELRNATEVLKDATEGIQTSLATLNETRSEFDAELEKRKEKRERRQTSPSELNDIKEKSIKLQQQATELERTFGSAKRDSSQGVDAANAYGEIVETLRSASNVAEQAVSTVEGQQDGVKEMKEKLGSINEESEEKRNRLKDVRVSLETLEHEASKAAKNVQRISEQVDKIRKASERAKSGMVTGLEDKSVMDKIKEAEEKVEAARAETEESKKESEAKRKELEEKTQNIVDDTTDAIQGIKTTKANLKQVCGKINANLVIETPESVKLSSSAIIDE